LLPASLSSVLAFVIVLAILVLVVAVVSAPLRRVASERRGGHSGQEAGDPESGVGASERVGEIAELEAAREAKYREIRDAELDHETGKLSDEDFAAVDQGLRAEAIEILHRLDRAQGR
jgi:hypothetical protein